jgi:hypothetical protein
MRKGDQLMTTDQQTASQSSGRSDSPSAGAQSPPDPQDFKQDAQAATEQLKDRARDRAEQGKQAAADQAEAVAGAVRDAAGRLGEQNESLAEYAERVSEGVSRMADRLRNRSIDELTTDAQDLARHNPTIFLLGSVAVGLALSRFMKASGQRQRGEYAQRGLDQASH